MFLFLIFKIRRKILKVFQKSLLSIIILSAIVFIDFSCNDKGDDQNKTKDKQKIEEINKSEKKNSITEEDEKSSDVEIDRPATKTEKEFKKLADEKGDVKLDEEHIISQGIIKTDITAKRIKDDKVTRDIRVQINQIDNSSFPFVKCFVSVTDREGNPLSVDPKLFNVEENGFRIPDGKIRSIEKHAHTDIEGDKGPFIPLNAILAIDKSGSMIEAGVKPENQPINSAKEAATEFINQVQTEKGDIVKVIAFDGDVHYLGANENAISEIKRLNAKGDTALYGVLYTAVRELEQGSGVKAVILLTDGRNDTRGSVNPQMKKITLADGLGLSEKLSIPVFTIGFGDKADTETLKKIAESSHALYFKTHNKQELKQLYLLIRNIINNQYIITYESKSQQVVTDVEIKLGNVAKDRRLFTTPSEIIEREKNLRHQIRIVKKREKELNALEKDILNKERKLAELEAKLNRKNMELVDKETKLKQLEKEVNNQTNKVEAKEKTVTNLQQKLDEKQQTLAERQDNLNERKQNLEQLKKQLEQRDREQTNLQQKLDAENKRIAEERTRINMLKGEINKIINEIKKEHNDMLNDLNQEFNKMDKLKP